MTSQRLAKPNQLMAADKFGLSELRGKTEANYNFPAIDCKRITKTITTNNYFRCLHINTDK